MTTKEEILDDEIEFLEFLYDDKNSEEPLPKWVKFNIKERLQKLKGWTLL